MAKFIEIVVTDGYEKIFKGQDGYDMYSSECCPHCYSEGGDYGIASSFHWNDEKQGWLQVASCCTCGHTYKNFIPYTED